jgi:hypothetical protein
MLRYGEDFFVILALPTACSWWCLSGARQAPVGRVSVPYGHENNTSDKGASTNAISAEPREHQHEQRRSEYKREQSEHQREYAP